MKKLLLGLIFAPMMVATAFSAETLEKKAEKMVMSIQEGCKTELGSFCKDVTPGEGRVLACLYAFEDKLTGQCSYALYDAATKLEKAVAQLSHVAKECNEDIDSYCSDVAAGQGRILNCLKKNTKKVSAGCNQALKDTNLQ
jgi:hypothetical protein